MFRIQDMGGCQNHGPVLGPLNTMVPYYAKHPRGDHQLDNHPYSMTLSLRGLTAAFCVPLRAWKPSPPGSQLWVTRPLARVPNLIWVAVKELNLSYHIKSYCGYTVNNLVSGFW